MNPSNLIDHHISQISDWRGASLKRVRELIHAADPEIVEEWKWGTPVFVHKKMVCAIAAFHDHIKINFFQGAALSDINGMFNAGLEAKKTRAIDLTEHDTLDEDGFKELIRSAVAYNLK